MPKEDSDDEDIWDYQPRHRTKQSQISKDTCVVRNDVNSTALKGSKQTSLKAKDRKRIGRKNTKEAVSKTQTSQELAATDENKNKIHVPDSNKNIVKQTCSSKAVKRNTRKKSKELKTPEPRERDKTEDDEKRSGFCPNCQMPYTALSIVQSPTWHVNECLDTPYSSKEECSAGLECDSTIPSHYKKFHHRALARQRSRLKSGEPSSSSQSETKRKIDFLKNTEKENTPIKPHMDTINIVESSSADEGITESRDVDQMLMDALDDAFSETFNIKSLASQGYRTSQDKTSHCSLHISSNDELIKKDMHACNFKSNTQQYSKASTKIDHSCVLSNMNMDSKAEDDILPALPSSSHIEPSEIPGSVVNTQTKKESGPSFFELSRSAQKEGFFAKKRRQKRNQSDTSKSAEEVPLKKARKSLDRSQNSVTEEDSKARLKVKVEKSSGDVNDCSQTVLNDLKPPSVGCNDELKVIDSAIEAATNEKQTLTETKDESDCDIKIQDIRSRACDIYFKDETFTEIVDKSVESNDIAGPCLMDDISSDSVSSRPDIFDSDHELNASEAANKHDFGEAIQKLTSGESGSGCYSRDTGSEDSSCLDTTLEADTSAAENNIKSSVSKPNEKLKDKPCERVASVAKSENSDKDQVVPSKPSTLMNAFSVLMQKGKSLIGNHMMKTASGSTGTQNVHRKELVVKREWPAKKNTQKAEDNSEDASSSAHEQSDRRSCPFYKKIPGTPFTVDAFRYGNIPGCQAYFLTHFHYDHYGGLTKKFSNPIYCSKITLNLVKSKIKVEDKYLHPLPLDTSRTVEGVEVTFLEANHCPGAVLILFRLKNGKAFLHTGDFRAHPKMEGYPSLIDLHVHTLYLDTTYCDPQYTFPPQEEVVNYAVQLAIDARITNPKTLIVCGSYTIGKERIFTAIAEALNCKICVKSDKKMVLNCLDDATLSTRVSTKWQDSGLHVLPMMKLNYKGLEDHLKEQGQRYDCVLALEPTGWTCNKKFKSLQELKPKLKRDRITVYGIPYSEHSSYTEMKRFVQFIKPEKILPTVNNGNAHSRRRMEIIFETWNDELKQGKLNWKKS